jgi:hypothetical protein
MPDNPTIKASGGGSRQDAATLGRRIGNSVASQFAGTERPVHIDTLHVKVKAGASQAELDRAIRQALDRALGKKGPQ